LKPNEPDYYKTLIGSEGLYLEDAYRQRKILRGMEDLFELWGFLPVQTPVFDYYEIYQNLIDSDAKNQIYRLFDREGDQLLLRNDITLFLARALGQRMNSLELPLRVFYADNLLRHEDREDISANEFYQVGAELLGLPGCDGDKEILLLLQEILAYLDLPHTQIHVGSRSLALDALRDLPEKEVHDILQAAETPDPLGVKDILSQTSLPEDRKTYLADFFAFMGTLEEAQKLVAFGQDRGYLTAEVDTGFKELEDTLSSLEKLQAPIPTVVDFSEIGSQTYYTGLVFRAYTQGVGSPIASGGRYDHLLERFGTPCPSIGFSLMIRKIDKLAGAQERFQPKVTVAQDGAGTFEDRFQKIQKLRKEGKPGVL
jgi:ATP phosphoribosyltransferase regulatory subunit